MRESKVWAAGFEGAGRVEGNESEDENEDEENVSRSGRPYLEQEKTSEYY